jgi:hypothetical protein
MRYLCALLLLASFPLMAAERQRNNVYTTQWDNVLPQVADGPGWSSRITLVNMGSVPAAYNLWFYHEDGSAWNIQLKGLTGESNLWTGTIPVGGSLFLETPGTGTETNVGWAYLETGYWISGMAAFKASWMACNDAEAVVPFTSEVDTDFFIPFDNRNGYVTSLAIVNPWLDRSAPVTVQFRNPDGTSLRLPDSFTLAPLQHLMFETTNKYPETVGKNGVIEFVVGGNAGASALGLLFTPRNSFTSVHAVSIDPHYFN